MGVFKFCKRKLPHAVAGFFRSVLLGALAGCLLGGCASLSEADAFYVATTPELFAPKPKGEPVNLLLEKPGEDFKVIGTMDWETPRRWGFVRRALERTARKHGADAVILRQKNNFRETTLVDIPPEMRWIPRTRIIYIKSGSRENRTTRAVPVTDFFPVWQPGYVAENVQDWTAVRAEFIVFEGTKPIGKIPSLDIGALDR